MPLQGVGERALKFVVARVQLRALLPLHFLPERDHGLIRNFIICGARPLVRGCIAFDA